MKLTLHSGTTTLLLLVLVLVLPLPLPLLLPLLLFAAFLPTLCGSPSSANDGSGNGCCCLIALFV